MIVLHDFFCSFITLSTFMCRPSCPGKVTVTEAASNYKTAGVAFDHHFFIPIFDIVPLITSKSYCLPC